MKRRNKKYNRVEAVRKNNLRFLKNYALTFFAADNKPEQDVTMTTLDGAKATVTPVIADAITRFPYQWSIMISVFCIEKGVNTCKMELVKFTERYYQKDLIEYLNAKHQAFIKKQRDMNVNITGAGWIASPNGRDISEDEAGNIFVKLGAF